MEQKRSTYQLRLFAIICSLLLFTGCLPGRIVLNGHMDEPRRHRGRGNYHKTKRIPPGHMPPPGQCRIWHPGVPPGHQPPPGNCYILSRNVPPDAWLIVG